MSNASASGARADDESPAGVLTLLREIFVQQIVVMLRYRVNFLAELVGAYLFFAVIFFGGQMIIDTTGASMNAVDSTFEGVIVGWFLYMIVQSTYFSLPGNVTRESEWGTLEQLYMSPYGFGTVMTGKVIVNVLHSLILGVLMLGLILVTTQRTLTLDVLTIVPIILLALMSVVGMGFVFAGLAMIYKRIENVFQIVQFGLIALIAAPVAGQPLLRLLPVVQGSAMLQDAMRNGVRIWEFPLFDVGLLVGTGVVYAVAGYVVFLACSRVARKRGVMGHY